MHTVRSDGIADAALIPAVDLTAELVTEWSDRTTGHPLSDQPLIYRVGRPPFTEAAGNSAVRYATGLIERAGGDCPTVFRIGLGVGAYAARLADGHPLPIFPPPQEAPGEWLMRTERDVSNMLLTRLAVDPVPPGSLHARSLAAWLEGLAQTLRGRAAARQAAIHQQTAMGRRTAQGPR